MISSSSFTPLTSAQDRDESASPQRSRSPSTPTRLTEHGSRQLPSTPSTHAVHRSIKRDPPPASSPSSSSASPIAQEEPASPSRAKMSATEYNPFPAAVRRMSQQDAMQQQIQMMQQQIQQSQEVVGRLHVTHGKHEQHPMEALSPIHEVSSPAPVVHPSPGLQALMHCSITNDQNHRHLLH